MPDMTVNPPGAAAGNAYPLTVRVRPVEPRAVVITLEGELTGATEQALMDAYAEASSHHPNSILLDFAELDYMNSTGIGLLVTLLVRANRQRQRLVACELSEHYRQIFELTRLDEAIGIADSVDEALAELVADTQGRVA